MLFAPSNLVLVNIIPPRLKEPLYRTYEFRLPRGGPLGGPGRRRVLPAGALHPRSVLGHGGAARGAPSQCGTRPAELLTKPTRRVPFCCAATRFTAGPVLGSVGRSGQAGSATGLAPGSSDPGSSGPAGSRSAEPADSATQLVCRRHSWSVQGVRGHIKTLPRYLVVP